MENVIIYAVLCNQLRVMDVLYKEIQYRSKVGIQ
tara:strand:+ start:1596 stop:1697 length:102 start_codon:yes stop_codon:yes gene_type:complete